MHGIENVKFVIAKQAKQIWHFKNIKEKSYKTNASVWYNKCAFVRLNCSKLIVMYGTKSVKKLTNILHLCSGVFSTVGRSVTP